MSVKKQKLIAKFFHFLIFLSFILMIVGIILLIIFIKQYDGLEALYAVIPISLGLFMLFFVERVLKR